MAGAAETLITPVIDPRPDWDPKVYDDLYARVLVLKDDTQSLVILALPSEMYCEYQLHADETSPFEHTIVYEIELTREWFQKAGPYLKLLTSTLSLVLPVASLAVKLARDDTAYKEIEEQLDFGKNDINAAVSMVPKIDESMGATDKTTLEARGAIEAHGATLRQLHALLKAKDPGFGGLVRVMNKRQEFLWVHEQFAQEYYRNDEYALMCELCLLQFEMGLLPPPSQPSPIKGEGASILLSSR